MPLDPIDLRAINCSNEIECFSSSFTSIKCSVTRKLVMIYKVIIVGIISNFQNVY